MTALDSETAADLRASIREVLSRHSTTRGAAAVDATGGYDAELWRTMGELGWLGVITDPRHGGSGLGMLAAVTIADELAYHGVCVPFLSSAVMATAALQEGEAEAADRWLPSLSTGEVVGAYCCTGRAGVADPELLDLVACPVADGDLMLDGEAGFVGDGELADLLVVAARSPEGELFMGALGARAAGVSVEPVATINRAQRLAHVRFRDVRVPRAEVLARGGDARALFEHVAERALVTVAADAHGAARRSFDLASEYVTRRHQFGRPIGSFQAVKHRLADMYVSVTASAACLDAAASALDARSPQAQRRVATAGAYIRQAAAEVVGGSMQLHGAIGYTWEHECHDHLKRAKSAERYLRSTWDSRERLAEIVLRPAAVVPAAGCGTE